MGCMIIRCQGNELKIVPSDILESEAKQYAIYFKRLFESKRRLALKKKTKKQIIHVEPDGGERFVNVDL